MPKPTFHNLPEKKRNTIIDAAIEEFADYGLENASTNRIVEKSGISKGSFYQYFEDKQDVFDYLLTVVEQQKMEFFNKSRPPDNRMDTFEYFRWMTRTGLEFSSSHPRLVQAISRIMFSEGQYFGAKYSYIRERTVLGLRKLIEQAVERGEMDPSVNVDLAVMVMDTWSNAISTYVLNEGSKHKDIMKWVRSPKTRETIDKLLYVMEYGLRKTESEFIAGP